MAILTIDQGTSATKALVVADDTVLASAEVQVRPTYLPGGAVEQDPQALLDSVLTAGRQAKEAAGTRIDLVTLANQGESVLAWDPRTGRPLTPVIVWQDRRSRTECDLRREHESRIINLTGLRLDPYFAGPKMAWVRRHLTTNGVVTTTDTWLVHQLTSEFVTDVTTASRTLLLDRQSRTWSTELADLFGVVEDLPRLVSNDELVGSTNRFGGDIPVGGLIVDQQAALFAQGCLETGEAKCTYGTGAFILVNAGLPDNPEESNLSRSVAWRGRSVTSDCLDGQVYTAASAVRWLVDLGLLPSVKEVDSRVADSTGGVTFLPALSGLGAPYWRPNAAASLSGLTLATGTGEILRAVLEGIALQVVDVLNVVSDEVGHTTDYLRADGGLTSSNALMQTQADLAQLPIQVTSSPHATALGSAAFGRLALDSSLAVSDAVPDLSPTTTFEPQWTADQAAERINAWTCAVEHALETDSLASQGRAE